VRIASRSAIVLALVAVTGAFTVLHKTVTLDVDGDLSTVTGYGRTVDDILTVANIAPGADDLVEPSLAAAARDGSTIVVRTSHQVAVEIDGEQRTVTTTAQTVGELLASLGPRGEGAIVNASRSAPLGREDIRVSTLKTVHVAVDGAVIPVTSSEPTVGQILSTVGLVLGEGDTTSVPLDAAAVDGMLIVVSRAATTAATVTEALAYETQEVADPNLPIGQRVVVTAGKVGEATTTYVVDTVGGIEVSRTVLSQVVTRQPQAEVIEVGTMEVSAVQVDPGSARAVAKDLAADRGWGDDQFACLDKLWDKESKWNASAENKSSGAYGIPQALPGSKMASAGSDWRTNPATQITWGLGYIEDRYQTPCGAWSQWNSKGWY
jgi:uncharacterized protein YabE (DUF348 family)